MGKSRMRTFCPHCNRIVPAGKKCPCREKRPERRQLEPWRKAYTDRGFERARQEVIERQRGRCKDCGRVCARWDGERWVTRGYGGEVDHETPLAEGGTNDAGGLALRCASCHRLRDAERRRKRSKNPRSGA